MSISASRVSNKPSSSQDRTSYYPVALSVALTTSVTVPATITHGSTVLRTSIATISLLQVPTTSYSIETGRPTIAPSNHTRSICAGDGLDSMSIGVLSTTVFSVVVGALIWATFAILQPRIPQIASLREWFQRPHKRPPLHSSLWAFFFPPISLVPKVPTSGPDTSPSSRDSFLFPSDDELSQRAIWIAFLLVVGWTVPSLAIAVPLFVVDTPCTGHTLPNAKYGGQYSALHDLSVIRLLRLLHRGSVTPGEGVLQRRLLVDGVDESHKARLRLLVLSIMVIVLAVAALLMLYREFHKLLSYRRLWLRVRCNDMEIGWLSVDQTPGLTGLGEGAVKDVFSSNGLVSATRGRTSVGTNESRRRRSIALARQGRQHDEPSEPEDANSSSYTDGNDIDVTGVFSVVDTRDAETLIHTRDRVLNSLELAESRYINAYRRSFPGSGPLLPIARNQSQHHHRYLKTLYDRIKYWREQLKTLNTEVDMEQQRMYFNIRNGISVRGWLLVGRGVRFLPGIRMIPGRSKDDIRWAELQNNGGNISRMYFWVLVTVASLLLALLLTPVLCLALGSAPNFSHYVPALRSLVSYDDLGPAIGTTLAPSLLTMLFMAALLGGIHYFAEFSGSASHSDNRTMELKAAFYAISLIGGVWLIGISAILFGLQAFNDGSDQATTVSEGVVYMTGFILALAINSAFIIPGLLLLQPIRLWHIISAQRKVMTPRQRFRALYPRTYNPAFGMGASILGVFFAAALIMLFPLIGPPLVILLFFTLMVHRYLVGYVYGRTYRVHSGASLHLWLIRRFATLVTLQPLLLGLILLAHRLWALGSLLLCVAVFGVVAVELYAETQTREPDVDSLSSAAWESLDKFVSQVMTGEAELVPYPAQFVAEQQGTRSSMASMLEMIVASLAVGPSASLQPRPVPFPKEIIDDLVSTGRAATAFATLDSPPRLNPTDPEDDVADFLYPPELLAPAPLIWLHNDSVGIAESRAYDLKHEHQLDVFLDGRSSRLKGSRRGRRTTPGMNEA